MIPNKLWERKQSLIIKALSLYFSAITVDDLSTVRIWFLPPLLVYSLRLHDNLYGSGLNPRHNYDIQIRLFKNKRQPNLSREIIPVRYQG